MKVNICHDLVFCKWLKLLINLGAEMANYLPVSNMWLFTQNMTEIAGVGARGITARGLNQYGLIE